MKDTVTDYCAKIGSNPLLVQGAGGNVSWKDGDTLWIKASGTWLADAKNKEIFVPVDFSHLKQAIALGDFAVIPRLLGDNQLRPSIETLLHALMPHPVVVHLHAIEILAHLVRPNFMPTFEERLNDVDYEWATVGYHKPGAALADAVFRTLAIEPEAQAILLQNHGVVIGGMDVNEIDKVLRSMLTRLETDVDQAPVNVHKLVPIRAESGLEYIPVPDCEIHTLATNHEMFARLAADWTLYPDHIVFLGAHPFCFPDMPSFLNGLAATTLSPELVFIKDIGVFVQKTFSFAKTAQLRCYFDVLARQKNAKQLIGLNGDQVAELLNWDAEQYRMHMAK